MQLNEGFEKTITDAEIERWRYPRFFGDSISGGTALLSGEEARHCAQVLRMKQGDLAVVCDGGGMDYLCRIASAQTGAVTLDVIDSRENEAEASINLRLFQCCPKSDKMEFIVQKAAELGAAEVIPVLSKRCVSRPDEKGAAKKLERYRKIAYEASKQCGRGKIMKISPMLTFSEAIGEFNPEHTGILFYECGGKSLNEIAGGKVSGTFDVFIGSEGGFEEDEVKRAERAGIVSVTLGTRILRCETAPIAAISVLMNLTGNM